MKNDIGDESNFIKNLTPNVVRELINIKADDMMDLIVKHKKVCGSVLNQLDGNRKNAFHYLIKSNMVDYFNQLKSELDFGSKENNEINNILIYALNKGNVVFFNSMMSEIVSQDIPFKNWCGGWSQTSKDKYKSPRILSHIIFSQPFNMKDVFKRLDFKYDHNEAKDLIYHVLFYALKPSIANEFIKSYQKSVDNISELKSIVSTMLYVIDDDFMGYYNRRYALDNNIDSNQYERLLRKLESQLLLSESVKKTPKGLSSLNMDYDYGAESNRLDGVVVSRVTLKL